MFASPPEINGAPTAKNSGGRTAPNKETPMETMIKFHSKGNTVEISRINTTNTRMVDPVTINAPRVNESTLTATFPLKKINPA